MQAVRINERGTFRTGTLYMKISFNKKTVLIFLAISNVISILMFFALGIKNGLFYLLSIFGYIPFYIGTIMYFKPSKVPQITTDGQMASKTLACPKCHADNTTRCMIHTVWVRNNFSPNWHVWKCPNCEIELTISAETKKQVQLTSLVLLVIFVGSGVGQFLPGVLFACIYDWQGQELVS